MDYATQALKLHAEYKGKIQMESKVPVRNSQDLATVYTPGAAEPCREIAKNPADVYTYTSKSNLVAVVSNGTAVLGLGNIGPGAAGTAIIKMRTTLFQAPLILG